MFHKGCEELGTGPLRDQAKNQIFNLKLPASMKVKNPYPFVYLWEKIELPLNEIIIY